MWAIGARLTDGYVDSVDTRHREMISHYLGTRAAVSKNVKKTDWRGCGGDLMQPTFIIVLQTI